MFLDIEESLAHELREVAESLPIPALPPLPQEPPRARPYRQPLLVAATVAMIVAGAVTLLSTGRESQGPTTPSGDRTEPTLTIPRTAPRIPYVLDQRLYVDGERVPGRWQSVQAGETAWLALRADNTWWWGRGAQPNQVTGASDVPPVISPNGKYVAQLRVDGGQAVLSGFDTGPGGEGLGSLRVDLAAPDDGTTLTIRGVTNDGETIVQGAGTSLVWLPLAGGGTVDLAVTAPGQLVLDSTPAGLVVTDGTGGAVDGTIGEPYLADISDTGVLTRIAGVPNHDDLAVSPGTGWLAWTAPGSTGGEVTTVPSLRTQTVDGTERATLLAPDGWGFRVRSWAWEDADHLVAPVLDDGDERMARCSAPLANCVLIDTR